ncbi:hypothetical protein LA303_07320 [Candidatus Sulfidibacterium hydrothermale]|uniref:hypothetical protein n=1 Tax=Candidatus Sulfidibacterium hydrothermale TaxID=2875962 RepID=UPI001F0A9660|nr:hypothetical protein [Candidatus Sulfidibacterium hydrothermale]UBM61235.1 hypothetical protein LA303_07320 [Candidatus Sulfidibacterium hydrothermale]
MKRFVLFLLFIPLLFAQQGCDELSKLTQFYIDYDTEITIPKTLKIDLPVDIMTPDITTNSESEFESNNTHKSLIDIINLSEMDMTITSPEEATFDFLKDIEISISADGLPEKKIAWLYDIPKTGLKKITLEVSTDDLKEYIEKDTYKLKTTTTTRELISHDTDVSIHSKFFVDAKILGL